MAYGPANHLCSLPETPMCDPQTLSLGGLGLKSFAAGSSAATQFTGTKAQATDFRTQAYMDTINSQLAEGSAQSALLQGQRQAGSIDMQGAEVKARQITSQAGNGVNVGSTSAVAVRSSTDIMKTVDEDTANANAVRAAWGYRTQATNFSNDALYKNAAASALSPGVNAFSTLLTGAGQVASGWYAFANRPY